MDAVRPAASFTLLRLRRPSSPPGRHQDGAYTRSSIGRPRVDRPYGNLHRGECGPTTGADDLSNVRRASSCNRRRVEYDRQGRRNQGRAAGRRSLPGGVSPRRPIDNRRPPNCRRLSRWTDDRADPHIQRGAGSPMRGPRTNRSLSGDHNGRQPGCGTPYLVTGQ